MRKERECAGQCPKCMSEDVQYPDEVMEDEVYIYIGHCHSCDIFFNEVYKIKYISSNYDVDK